MVRSLWFLGAVVLLLAGVWFAWGGLRPLGRSFAGDPPPFTQEELALREELRRDVEQLAGVIGERNLQHPEQLAAAADFIENSFAHVGLRTTRDSYQAGGRRCDNLVAEVPGATSEIIVLGAHYDSVPGSPGANDNASGVAALLALARHFAEKPAGRTLRFVAFTNEEPASFQTEIMGSLVYAQRCRARGDRIAGMISLETIGYYSSAPHSQKFPVAGLGLIYPTAGNFIAFVSNLSSARWLQPVLKNFRQHAHLPSEGAALPASVPGVGWSDHWAFWQAGYRALMITDTAPFRYPHYHQASDTPDKLDYDAMTHLVSALEETVGELANDGG